MSLLEIRTIKIKDLTREEFSTLEALIDAKLWGMGLDDANPFDFELTVQVAIPTFPEEDDD